MPQYILVSHIFLQEADDSDKVDYFLVWQTSRFNSKWNRCQQF